MKDFDKNLDILNIYSIDKKEWLETINSWGFLLCHKKTKAKIVLISNDDNNKVFNIAFKTPAPDNTGVPHILEHSVLCGSKKYPLKDPFIELAKGSLNTFLNAMTYPEKTMYPVASCNEKDFMNLTDVYLDAVFNPNIYENEKIFKQEGWCYELNSPEDELKINGVVYNEMKGAFSDPEDTLDRMIQNSLFMDTNYANESGGDPKEIPSLSYKDFLAFHKKYYHPSNSYIYLYGDMDMEKMLKWLDDEYLSKYDFLNVDSKIIRQNPFNCKKEFLTHHSIGENDEVKDNTFLSYNVVIDDYEDVNKYIAFQVIEYALFNMPGAPIKEALTNAKIGKEIYGEYQYGSLQPYFEIVARGANYEQKQEFIKIINEKLQEIVEQGFDKQSLLGGLNTIEFKTREADFGDFPKGLLYGITMFHTWLYNYNNPFGHIKTNETFEFLRKNLKTGYFENLIKEYFLNNNHGSIVISTPKKGLTAIEENKLKEKLKSYKNSLSKEEIINIVKETKELTEYKEEPTPDEIVRKIPLLKIEDIKQTPEIIDNTIKEFNGINILHHDIFTNKIAYVNFAFDGDNVPLELVPYLGLYRIYFGMLNTKNYKYKDLANETTINMGGINYTNSVYQTLKTNKTTIKCEIRSKVIYDKLEYVFMIMKEIINNTKYDDKKRMKDLLAEAKVRIENNLINGGNQTALLRAMSYYSENAYLNEMIKGIEFYRFIKDLYEKFDEKYEEIVENLLEIQKYIYKKQNLVISFGGCKDGYDMFIQQLPEFLDKLKDDKNKIRKLPILNKQNEGFKTPSMVQYVAMAGKMQDFDGIKKGSLKVLKTILNYDYLWNNVRVKGGAYGCGFNTNRQGDCYMASYRDPNLLNTVEIYKKIPEYIKNFNADERTMIKYIIGTISDMDTPLTPSSKAGRGYSAYVNEIDYDMLLKDRKEVLNTSLEDIKKLSTCVEAAISQNNICVVGSESKITNENIFNKIEAL